LESHSLQSRESLDSWIKARRTRLLKNLSRSPEASSVKNQKTLGEDSTLSTSLPAIPEREVEPEDHRAAEGRLPATKASDQSLPFTHHRLPIITILFGLGIARELPVATCEVAGPGMSSGDLDDLNPGFAKKTV
jgi:hypothetical protein